jgi:hypothetical protein
MKYLRSFGPLLCFNCWSNSNTMRYSEQDVILWVDTEVSEKYSTSIVRFEMCKVRNHLGYVDNLQGR